MVEQDVVRFRYRGVPCEAPTGLTIMRALEHGGLHLTAGSGCRAGFCGACAVFYRLRGGEVRVALACQTPVGDGMDLSPMPYFPVHRADFDVSCAAEPAREINRLYPELATCLGCNTCTRSCPVGLDVMGYVGALLSGDLQRTRELSFDCVSCGLCAARCPAGITPYTAALHARRGLGARRGRSASLARRLDEIQGGAFAEELRRLRELDPAALERAYLEREIRV
jgi:succinate dehydrogenase/fumarate reductase-like Fe-S protein